MPWALKTSEEVGMRRLLVVASLFLLAGPSLAAAAGARTETVTFKAGGEDVQGFLAVPESKGPHPALVVIHEWWGLNDWVKEQAQKFAENGYVALAVDLYRGKVASDPELAHELSRGLPADRAVRDMKAAFDYLAARPDVDKSKIGSVGWCMGGGYSLALALNEPRLAACIINYGHLVSEPSEIAKIHAPILGNFGGQDRGITPDDVHAFEKALKDAGKSIDVKIYSDAGHAFENPNNKMGYRAADAEDAWTRMVDFFNKTLK
jgi:carboxymethylenebutenolidase